MLDTLGKCPPFYKGDNFRDFLFATLLAKSNLGKGLYVLSMERLYFNTLRQIICFHACMRYYANMYAVFNLFMPSGLFYLHPLDRSISNIRGV